MPKSAVGRGPAPLCKEALGERVSRLVSENADGFDDPGYCEAITQKSMP